MKSKRQWIEDEQKQKQILQSLHDDPAGGCHFGRDKTRDKIASRYFWHGQYDDIDEYIKTCEKCQKVCLINSYFLQDSLLDNFPTSLYKLDSNKDHEVINDYVSIHAYNIDKSQVQETSITVKANPSYHHMGSNWN